MRRPLLLLAAFTSALAATADAAPAKDPKVVALAGAAAKCKFEEGYFDDECKAYKAWRDEEKLFADGKADLTVLAMLEDADVKQRVLASDKGFDDSKKLLADKANVLRLIAAAKKETHVQVARTFAQYLSRAELEKLEVFGELDGLLKHPLPELRASLGFNLYANKQTPERLAFTKKLLADTDPKVPADALKGLSMGAARGKSPEACKLMGEQIARPEGDALWQVATSECTSVFDALATALLERASDPVRAAKDGVSLSLATGAMCRAGTDAHKKKGFAAAKALADAKVKNANVRASAVDALVGCDKAGAKVVLGAMAKDPDKYVAERATKALAAL